MERILGDRLLHDSGPVRTASLTDYPFVCVYVSALWCPPCRLFTPQLVEFYNEVNKEQKLLEIVFVSRDRNLHEFNQYKKEMPWLAVPYDLKAVQSIIEFYDVQGMPRLLLVDSDGSILYDKCRIDVSRKGPVCIDEWPRIS